MRRTVAVALAVVVLSVGTPAGAAETLGWWYTASGSAHCTRDANHVVCAKYTAGGEHLGTVADFWLPSYCQYAYATSGDNAGTPLRLRFRSPYSYGQGCVGNGQSAWYGWADGYGHAEGQNYWSPNYVTEQQVYEFPRDSSTPAATATQVNIY